jgi:VCBS repeat-containing protein
MNPWKILMTTQIDPLTGSSPFKSIVAPLNSNDLLDAILYRSDSIVDTSIESIISSKKQTKLSKSVGLNSTDNQFQTNTQPVLLSNTNNLSPSSLQSASLNPSQITTATTKNLAPIVTASAASPASAAVSKVRIEAETITNRSVYRVENISAASGGKALSLVGGAGNEVGKVSFKFTGVDGLYDVVLGTFDENDGRARFNVRQNGSAIGSITLNQSLGSDSPNAQTAVARKVTTVQIKNGDTFVVKGFENAGEHVRLDYIDFIPSGTANTPPTAIADQFSTGEKTSLALAPSQLLGNDSDINKDTLTIASIDNSKTIGQVSFNGTSVNYSPNGKYQSLGAGVTATDTFSYTISDGKGGTATAPVSIKITGVNDAPTATSKSGTTNQNQAITFLASNLLVGAIDPDVGDVLKVTSVTQAVNGTVVLNASGNAVFTPTSNFTGNGSFNYVVSDGKGGATSAKVSVVVNPVTVNRSPVANGDSATTKQNQAVTLLATNLLANDTDADGDKLTLSSVKSAVNGSVVLNASGNPVFTPTANFSGNSSFDYVVSDGKGGTATATVKVLVTNPAIALPDLVTKFAPKSNPALPTGKDIFAPSFVVNDAGNSSRPAIAEWTRTGKAGETIVLTGWQLDANTKFFVYGQTNGTNGALLEAKIQKLDIKSQVAGITLPTGLPQGSSYLLWAQNSSGYSQPVMLNQTETWWVKETSSRGQIASVFGRNLSQDGGIQNSQVYLEDSAGKGYWAQVVGVNPYKVDFKVPDALANGDYQVFVHNGDGGQYGWSKPLTMTIDNGLNYTGAVFNVKNYGAKGDGITNDTAAINAARAAADNAPWSTVYLPTGTYVVNDTLWTSRDQVRWLGDGKDVTTIKAANDSSQRFLFQADNVNQITFQDLTLDANVNNGSKIEYGTLIRGSSDLQYLNVKINAEGAVPFDWNTNHGVSMKNSQAIGLSNFLGNAKQVFIDGSQFFGTGSGENASLFYGFGVENLSITNSTGQSLDSSDANSGKWVNGRFFVDHGIWGIAHNQYLGNNQTIDLATSPSFSNQNDGEQILWEQGDTLSTLLGTVTSTTANTVTVNEPSSDVNDQYYISIIGGKGIGQSRQVQSLNQSTYTIYDNWNVQPDSSSIIVANQNVSNAVVYGNSLDGLSDYNSRQTASAGVQTYFGSTNLIVDNNTFNQLRTGISLWSGGAITDNNPVNFTQISNNLFTNNLSGVSVATSGQQGTSTLGTSIRNNNFNNVGDILSVWQNTDPGTNPLPIANMNVLENNTLGTGGVSIDQGNGNIQNTIFLNDTSLNGPLNLGVVSGNFEF